MLQKTGNVVFHIVFESPCLLCDEGQRSRQRGANPSLSNHKLNIFFSKRYWHHKNVKADVCVCAHCYVERPAWGPHMSTCITLNCRSSVAVSRPHRSAERRRSSVNPNQCPPRASCFVTVGFGRNRTHIQFLSRSFPRLPLFFFSFGR